MDKAMTPLGALELVCGELFDRWDKDMRAGKLLTALTGTMPPGYDPRVDLIRASLATPAPDSEKLREAKEAFQALLNTHDEDHDMDEFPDDDSVGAYQSEGGEVRDLPLTFGILRRARRALAALGASL